MQIGSQVIFGRPQGKKSVGVVIKINKKSIVVQVTEPGGLFDVGQKVAVDLRLCENLGKIVQVPPVKESLRVQVGTRFRACYADTNPLWEVKRARGRDTWDCEVVDEPVEYRGRTYASDWAGIRRVYGGEEIRAILQREKDREHLEDKHKAFYEGLEVGAVVHYHNGFGEYVRCEVVLAKENSSVGFTSLKRGEKCLKPVALVGNWSRISGDLYHVKAIKEGALFQPHFTNVFEHPDSVGPGVMFALGRSPAEMEPVFCL